MGKAMIGSFFGKKLSVGSGSGWVRFGTKWFGVASIMGCEDGYAGAVPSVCLDGELDAALGELAAHVARDAEDLARLVLELLLGDEEDA